MKPNSTLRAEARRHLDGMWGTFVLMTFLLLIIQVICRLPSEVANLLREGGMAPLLSSSLTLVSLALFLLYVPFSWSYAICFLRNHRDERTDINDLLAGHRQFSRVFGTVFLQGLYTLLWTLLLIIPGIIKSLSYALTPYILHDHAELQYNSAIERSMEMMDGHKMRLFLLYLSFIGWGILALFTCGLGFLWLTPYVNASLAAFYEDVRADYEANYAFNDERQADYASMNAPGSDF